MYFFSILAILTILIVRFSNIPAPRPIFSIYRLPDKWYYLKCGIFYLFLKLRKNMILFNHLTLTWLTQGFGDFLAFITDNKIRISDIFISIIKSSNKCKAPNVNNFKSVENLTEDSSVRYEKMIVKLESPKKLVKYPQAFDYIYFNAANSDGYHLITGFTLRPHGIVNGFLYVKIPGIGLLESLKLPDTVLFQDEMEKSLMLHEAEGLHLTLIQPMKKWKISFQGKMKIHGIPKNEYDVLIDAVWSTNLTYFDMDWDIDTLLLAKAYAKEQWSHEFFETVKNMHQTHYEQYGKMKGVIVVNGETHIIKLSSLRNHIYGYKTQMRNVHRCVSHMISLEHGSKISIGIFSTPVTLSCKEYGYIYDEHGELHPITSCSFKLHDIGENGTPPIDYSYVIKSGQNTYHIQVNVIDSAEYFLGLKWDLRVVECMAKFSVNGAIGWGGVQWQYQSNTGRPSYVSYQDPECAKTVFEQN